MISRPRSMWETSEPVCQGSSSCVPAVASQGGTPSHLGNPSRSHPLRLKVGGASVRRPSGSPRQESGSQRGAEVAFGRLPLVCGETADRREAPPHHLGDPPQCWSRHGGPLHVGPCTIACSRYLRQVHIPFAGLLSDVLLEHAAGGPSGTLETRFSKRLASLRKRGTQCET